MANKNFDELVIGKNYSANSGRIYFVCNSFIEITNSETVFFAVMLNSTTIFKFDKNGRCLENIKDRENQNLVMCIF
jgi:hypothetical protein